VVWGGGGQAGYARGWDCCIIIIGGLAASVGSARVPTKLSAFRNTASSEVIFELRHAMQG
jgi:hypothetical protein